MGYWASVSATRNAAYPHLAAWIDSEQQSLPRNKAGILGGIAGGGLGAAGGIFGATLAITSRTDPAFVLVLAAGLLLIPVIATILAWRWLQGRETEMDRARLEATRSQRMQWYNLLSARWQGSFLDLLGAEGAQALDEAARDTLRVRAALQNPIWTGLANLETRNRLASAVDATMLNLALSAVDRAPLDSPAIREPRLALAETVETAERVIRSSQGEGPASHIQSLRTALAEAKLITEATEELRATE